MATSNSKVLETFQPLKVVGGIATPNQIPDQHDIYRACVDLCCQSSVTIAIIMARTAKPAELKLSSIPDTPIGDIIRPKDGVSTLATRLERCKKSVRNAIAEDAKNEAQRIKQATIPLDQRRQRHHDTVDSARRDKESLEKAISHLERKQSKQGQGSDPQTDADLHSAKSDLEIAKQVLNDAEEALRLFESNAVLGEDHVSLLDDLDSDIKSAMTMLDPRVKYLANVRDQITSVLRTWMGPARITHVETAGAKWEELTLPEQIKRFHFHEQEVFCYTLQRIHLDDQIAAIQFGTGSATT